MRECHATRHGTGGGHGAGLVAAAAATTGRRQGDVLPAQPAAAGAPQGPQVRQPAGG